MTARGPGWFRDRVRCDDAGMAAILVFGVAGLVLLLATVTLSTATFALRSSAQHGNYEQSIHLAEHGVDQTVARLLANRLYATTAETPPSGATPQQEEDWARTRLEAATAYREPQGEFAVLKPAGRKVIYAAGWVPNRANARYSRLVKVDYLFSTSTPARGVLTNGSLTISGNPDILGPGGVHANGDITMSGNPEVTGDATASGGYAASGNPAIGGASGGSHPPEEVPRVEPAELYDQLSGQYAAAWYDLCPNGKVRRPASSPCTGVILADTSTGPAYLGWKLTGTTWTKSSGVGDGVFYVHEGSVSVSGNQGEPDNPWRTTIIAASQSTGSGCPQDYGDIDISGNPVTTPYIPGLMLVAGRDLKISGNPSQGFEGLFVAGEQFELSGNPSLTGAIIAQDRCPDSPLSPVHVNKITGNLTLTHDSNLEVPIDGLVRITLWLEL